MRAEAPGEAREWMEVAPMIADAAALGRVNGIATPRPMPVPGVARDGARRRVDLSGALIDRIDFDGAGARIRGFLAAGGAHQVVTVNLDFLSIAERDPHFRDTINRADLAVADGMPLVWASRLTDQPLPQRIAGVDLVDACCEIAAETGAGVFLLGAAPGVAEVAGKQMKDLYPGLQIVGTYSPPFGGLTGHENERIVASIRAARPAFLFVAFGAPRQDQWIRAHLGQLGVPVCMGVGCVLDLLAGNVNRAPGWMQRTGLEWAFRLSQEPARLWRRYILDDVPTLGRLVFRAVRQRRSTRIDELV
jgi:N-acetylglucosaminyldiphosphoundecaprenol N-acetyl-beta-D-mannosaminyltransferase